MAATMIIVMVKITPTKMAAITARLAAAGSARLKAAFVGHCAKKQQGIVAAKTDLNRLQKQLANFAS